MNKWQEKWHSVSGNIGGGQGDCFLVQPLTGSIDKKIYFLKTLKDGDNTERRRRFYIETVIYQSINIKGIPKIIETNSLDFSDKQEALYYVCEYIGGDSLDKLVTKTSLTEEKVLLYFRQLLEILSQCHSREIVHRDIKPENIIINDDFLFLVDFGISYYDTSEFQHLTKIGQEIGNRFLRLPEFAAGSANKRDPRSDLTLALGVALYMISGEYPRTLINEEGKYPHQLSNATEKIKIWTNAGLWNLLFDKGFQPNIDRRWTSAKEILSLIEKMQEDRTEDEQYEELLKQYARQIDHEYLKKLSEGLEVVYLQLNKLLNQVVKEKAPGFYTEQQQWLYSSGATERKAETSIYAIGKGKSEKVAVLFKAVQVGNQVAGVLQIGTNEHELARVLLGEQISDEELLLTADKITALVLPPIAKLIT